MPAPDLLRRYRLFLENRARATPSGSMIPVIQALTLPWLIPLLLALLIGWRLDLGGLPSLWLSLPPVGIALLGGGYITYVFLAELKRRYSEAKAKER